MFAILTAEGEEAQEQKEQSPVGSARGSRPTSQKSRPHSRPQSTVRGKRDREEKMKEQLEEAATDLLQHFNNRNLDALLKLTRNTLEGLRKRITSSSMVHYLGGMCFGLLLHNLVSGRCHMTALQS